MTTRKVLRLLLPLAAALLGLGGAGCATRGPLHVYAVSAAQSHPIVDDGDGGRTDVPSFLEPADRLDGFAYDPFTDHFFLRLDPGNRIRVVDRPARAIKREFTIEGAPAGGGDLAVRPRDGHLFLLGPLPGQILETTRLGKLLGEFRLASPAGRPVGLALDTVQDRLLVLDVDGQRVTLHDLRGQAIGEIRLQRPAGSALSFDSEQREFYAPLRDAPAEIGVFAEDGRLRRTLSIPKTLGLVDVGPRSFIRVF